MLPQLTRSYTTRWDSTAKEKINRIGRSPTPGQVIANLPFSFWVQMFAKDYDDGLWRQYLSRLFPRQKRDDIHAKLDNVRTLRNRIAHHEHFYQRHLGQDFNTIRTLLKMLSPEMWGWTEHHSRVQRTLTVSPGDLTTF